VIVFKKLRYKNFLSSGNTFTQYDLNSRNNTLIIGKNGSGKSTLLDALTFSLFGKAYRNINKPSLVNSVNQKDCMVELEFSIGKKEYVIRRGLKPAVFDITVDGIELDKNASVKDFQNNLESNVLKMNYKSFCSVVILGARYDSFMNMSPADRRKVVEDVLDIEIFSEMNVVLKEKLSKLKESIRDNESEIRLNEEKKTLQQSNIETSIKEREEEIQRKQSKIAEIQTDVDNDVRTLIDDKINISRIKNEINTNRPPLEKKKKQAEEIFRDLNKKKGVVDKERKFYVDNESCPTCMQDIDETFRTDMIGKKVSTLQDVETGIEQLSDTLESLNTQLESFDKLGDMLQTLQNTATSKENRVRAESNRIKSLKEEISELREKNESPSDDREKVLKDLEHTIVILEDEKFGLSQKKKSHDIAYDMLKDSGIKAKIIENYLPVINAQINEHLQDLDFYVKFELDETFNETIKSRHLDEFTYASFSEGEKARIDLALLFTWRKIAELKNSVSTNLLILDEVFDGSLDAIGADEVMAKLLFKQSQHFDGQIRDTQRDNTNVFVISHKVDLIDKFNETIKFEKVRGFSKMV
jgi:DNA repair exonuclease SbcCD ATPase subunit